jgi:TDG/mug DNA glycosylase family protein
MPRGGTTRTFTVSFPPDLAEQVERLAKKESRTTSELFREAFRVYRAEQLRAILDESNAEGRARGHKGYGPEDVERLVDEDRAERWKAKKSQRRRPRVPGRPLGQAIIENMRCSGFGPAAERDARVLILGSLPGKISLERGEYYANPRNAFWSIMGELVGAHPNLPYESRLDQLQRKRIALWDVCASAERTGSLDAKIVKGTLVPNDFNSFLRGHPQIQAIFFNGSAAAKLFRRSLYPYSVTIASLQLHTMDSTSPARTIPKDEKLRRWRNGLSPYLTSGKVKPIFGSKIV